MPSYDFQSPRLYVSGDLAAGSEITPGESAIHYLRNVLRLEAGAGVLAFNGRDGEWRARVAIPSKRELKLEILDRTRPQPVPSPLHYAFAPVKHARLDFMVQKAVELGAGRLTPVITQHTQVSRVNTDRMRANMIEAAEQCGVLALPVADEPVAFDRWLAEVERDRTIVFCDEDAEISDPLLAMKEAPPGAFTLIVGPEGGFDEKERAALLARERVIRLSLGPRILRADTAAVAALAVVQAVRGDWR
jgi:16S rRNA (uracil1498-N3)-methyltransferase